MKRKRFVVGTALALWVLFATIGAVDFFARTMTPVPPVEVSADVTSERHTSFEQLAEPLTPSRLSIPKLGVDTPVEPVGVNARGNMTVPSTYQTVSWYRPGAKAGAAGNTVIAGHLDNSLGLPGVFERLHTLSVGDTVAVEDAAGRSLPYSITSMTVYETGEAPAAEVFATEGPSQLVLITCNGAWDHEKKSYDKRLVVVAKPL